MADLPSWDPCLDAPRLTGGGGNEGNARPPLPPKPQSSRPATSSNAQPSHPANSSKTASKTALSPGPVFTMAVLSMISELQAKMKPDDSVLPSNAQQLLQLNKADKNKDEFIENTFIIDVRSQAEISSHVINGRAYTLIRGGIPFPLALMEKVGGERSAYPEPLCDDPAIFDKQILVSCTDGRISILAWDVLRNACGFKNVKVIQGGITAWAAAKLPLISTAILDISSDEEDDD